MLIAWESTPVQVILHAIQNLVDENSIIYVDESQGYSAAHNFIFGELSNGQPKSGYYTIYETHSEVWGSLAGDLMAEENSLDGLAEGLKKCMEGNSSITVVALTDSRGDLQTVFHIVSLLYGFGAEIVKTSLVSIKADEIFTRILPCGYKPKVRFGDPDVLFLLLIHSLLQGRKPSVLRNVGQIKEMIVETGIDKYLPAKKGTRSTDGYYRALKRVSEDMVQSCLLDRSTLTNKDEYYITSLGLITLRIIQRLPELIGKDGRRIINDSAIISKKVKEFKPKSARKLFE